MMDVGILEDTGENKRQKAHHQKRIGYRPGDSQRHISVTNPKVLEHQILNQEDKIAIQHAVHVSRAMENSTYNGSMSLPAAVSVGRYRTGAGSVE
jgi:hypothetical protein